jgi:8-amino-7-oxononanoate synthase
LIQFARPYIYTTAMPPAVAAATRTSLRLLQAEQWRRTHLQQLIAHFRAGAERLGLQLMNSFSPIQPLLIGDEAKALAIAEQLADRGILIIAIRPPTVAVGSSRLRITFSAEHSLEQVNQLLSALADILGEPAHD